MAKWQEYPEKNQKMEAEDELLINSGWFIKRIKALQFKGEKGEKWETGAEGPRWLQGPRWEQGLRGPEGPRWLQGPAGAWTGDLLSKNNLADLADKTLSRENLKVYSKAEVDAKIPTLPDLPDFWTFVLKESWKWLSSNDFTNEEKQKLASLEGDLNKKIKSEITSLEWNLTKKLNPRVYATLYNKF